MPHSLRRAGNSSPHIGFARTNPQGLVARDERLAQGTQGATSFEQVKRGEATSLLLSIISDFRRDENCRTKLSWREVQNSTRQPHVRETLRRSRTRGVRWESGAKGRCLCVGLRRMFRKRFPRAFRSPSDAKRGESSPSVPVAARASGCDPSGSRLDGADLRFQTSFELGRRATASQSR
jgi:hypothetical protein